MRFLIRLILRIRFVADDGAFGRAERMLIICNHSGRLDALVLTLFLPCDPVAVVSPEEASERPLRWVLPYIRHVVLDIGNPRSAKPILRLLHAGQSVILFPEARVAVGEAVLKIHPVCAVVALGSRASVLPVYLDKSAQGRLRTTLRVFTPVRVDEGLSGSARQRRALSQRRLFDLMHLARVQAVARKPLYENFLDAMETHGRNFPVIEDRGDQAHTYRDILRMSLSMSRLLRRFTADRETVGVLLPNVIGAVAVVMGLSAAGRVPAIFNYSDGPQGVESARVVANVRTVITSRRFVARAQLLPLLEALYGCRLVFLEDLGKQFGLFDKIWLFAYAMRLPHWTVEKQSTLDAAVVLFTSGSEGKPKGVVLSHASIVANVAQMRAVFDFSSADKVLNPLPFYHAYSFTAGVILPLITGTRVNLFISPLRYRDVADTAYRRKCTILLGTSTFLSFYARYADPADFSQMRRVISGGEKLSPGVARIWMEKFGVRIMEGYGCTECSPVVALSTPAAFRHGTVGRFLPGVEYRIEPVQGIALGGVLHVRGPNLMLGYYTHQNPGVVEAPGSSLGEGWYDTGDVVEVDRDALVSITGRIRRFAKIAGEMVSLDEVEHVAREASPGFHHAAVLGVQEQGGETTLLFTTDPQLTRARLLDAAKLLGTHDLCVARRLAVVRELPLLASGKIDYVTLKGLIDGDTIKQSPPAALQ